MEPHASTSTMLNPTGSLDLRRLTYSLALTSPASKCETPFCSGTCFATFSLWKLKNTNLPKKRESPVLKLMTSEGLSSALILRLLGLVLGRQKVAEMGFWNWKVVSVGLLRGLRPWKVGVENRVEAIVVMVVVVGGGGFGYYVDKWSVDIINQR
ncbi:uncharacterized protein LOC111376463 [Olea europaea var. sylvestris]|uniref:uncharacterized protein LOC111376462 n=1 Tax=Olea europaea var. sylvestris TaxID=158386 RepID=UPI000C1CDC04|nr:uncharacterized protein LOC111376462 [Olea europaea var. sylvestris]XP_022855190.1 uncharacterized protein LOC111376463 [Olea europaea var. sylvestris]